MNGFEEPIMADGMAPIALRVRKQSSDHTSSAVTNPDDPILFDRLNSRGISVGFCLLLRHLSPYSESDRIVARLPPCHLQILGGSA